MDWPRCTLLPTDQQAISTRLADPRSDRIVFSSRRNGHRNLWISKPDGTEAHPLTTEDAIDEHPSFSQDGQQIAFVSDRGGRRGIWVMGAEGGAPKFLAAATVLDTLTWSRDGKRILFARPESGQTHLAAISRRMTARSNRYSTPANAAVPAWSPTADVIAYLEPTIIPPQGPSSAPVARLWLRFVDLQGRRLYADVPNQGFSNGLLAWAPDGRRLAAVDIPANGVASVWIAEPGAREPFKKPDRPACHDPAARDHMDARRFQRDHRQSGTDQRHRHV